MGKRVDNDSTMELSTSQLVPDAPRGDASVWKQVVVGTDQFTPAAARSPGRRWGWIVVALVLLAGAAVAAGYFWV